MEATHWAAGQTLTSPGVHCGFRAESGVSPPTGAQVQKCSWSSVPVPVAGCSQISFETSPPIDRVPGGFCVSGPPQLLGPQSGLYVGYVHHTNLLTEEDINHSLLVLRWSSICRRPCMSLKLWGGWGEYLRVVATSICLRSHQRNNMFARHFHFPPKHTRFSICLT